MSDRMYLYEAADDTWHALPTVGESPRGWCAEPRLQDAEKACAAAKLANLSVGPVEEVRFLPLPGWDPWGPAAYYVWFSEGCSTIVSTVALPWMPESSRRGVITLGWTK